ncbi:hypothetical protein C491_12030 [Natronococcus amylolyticus DSM 10524]|uniref:Uncharacterized protein n=1 Tax=Natronococcus amylolyticus DSM 10524 TaxID=1227497 RepID=L9X5J0_9EURY|nr:hypothetical protein [Natronococcus amylolyticus]ELY56731.1 hypothetical protein C491_12030 [Natronococcus amylolyticus DSM 10524]
MVDAITESTAVREAVLLLVVLPPLIGAVSYGLGDGFGSGAAFGFSTAVVVSALIVLWGPMGQSDVDR